MIYRWQFVWNWSEHSVQIQVKRQPTTEQKHKTVTDGLTHKKKDNNSIQRHMTAQNIHERTDKLVIRNTAHVYWVVLLCCRRASRTSFLYQHAEGFETTNRRQI